MGGTRNRQLLTPGTLTRFEKNFFDLLPSRPRTVFLETDLLPDVVAEFLTIKTLAEIPQKGISVAESPAG